MIFSVILTVVYLVCTYSLWRATRPDMIEVFVKFYNEQEGKDETVEQVQKHSVKMFWMVTTIYVVLMLIVGVL